MFIRTRSAVYTSWTLASLGAALFVGSASAQTMAPPAPGSSLPPPPGQSSTPNVVEEVVVTGSRITRRDYVSDTPIVTVGQALVSSAGSPTLDTALNTLPQISSSASASASFTANGGQANVDLRGMGTQRTLVLVDGNRLQPSLPNGSVDLNTIPSALVDNVEVITGGASAVYGSDAIAGVVNIKLKPHFTGVEVDAQAGATGAGDGGTQDIAITAGTDFADHRGNVFVSFDYANREAVKASDRSYLEGWYVSSNLPSSSLSFASANLPSQAALNGVFAKYGYAPGSVAAKSSMILSTNQDGTLFSQPGGVNYKGSTTDPFDLVTAPGQFGASAAQVGPLLSVADFVDAQIPLTRYSLLSKGDYEVSNAVTVYYSGIYTHYTTETLENPDVLGSSCCTPVTVPVTNPFIPTDLATLLASRPNPNAPFNLTQSQINSGPRIETDQYDLYQITVGAKGKLPFQDITWNAYVTHSDLNYNATESGYHSSSAFNTLLAAPGGGTGICTGGLNPFGINPISASCAAYIDRTAHNSETLGQDVVELDTQGRLFQVPAGEARFAAGVDYRRNSYNFSPDAEISSGDLSDYASQQGSSGAEDAKEIYLELLSPLVRNLPLAKQINLDLGYRYSDYDTSGGVSTYKADFDWEVIDWAGFRGGFAHATRAPSVGELFLASTGSSISIGNAGTFGSGDPCDATGAYLNPKNPDASKVAALCAAQGVPVGFVNTQPRPLSTTQGNLALKPESADTYSFGVVLKSTFEAPLLSHMSASIDYYNINVTNTIGTVGANATLDDCYSAETNPTFSLDDKYCQLISRRSATGLIEDISNPLQNLGNYETSGIDLQTDWSAPFDAVGLPSALGSLDLNLLVNYLDDFMIQSAPNAPRLNFAGTIGNTQIDQYADAHPKWKATVTLSWRIASVETSFRWRYLDGMKDYAFVGTSSTGPGAPAISYFDLDSGWTVRPGLQLSIGIENLLNKAPPVLPWMSFGTDPYTYDVIGRRGFVKLTSKF